MTWVPPEEYFKNLPRKWAGGNGLFFNKESKILIVKPIYKETWLIVGGNVDKNESPLETFKREAIEEIGIKINEARLLCVQYVTDPGFKGDRVQFCFDGGELSNEQIASIALPADELSAYRFVTLEESSSLFDKLLYKRVEAAFKAKKENKTLYIETKI